MFSQGFSSTIQKPKAFWGFDQGTLPKVIEYIELSQKEAAWKAKSARGPSGTRSQGTLGEQGKFPARRRCPGIESRLGAVHFSKSRPLLFEKVLCFLWLLKLSCHKTLKSFRFLNSEVTFDLACVGDRKTWKNETSKSPNSWWNLTLFAASERQHLL